MRDEASGSGQSEPVRVRLASPSGRPIQLRYRCPETGKPIRISTGTRDLGVAERQRAELEARLLLGQCPKQRATTTPAGGPDMPWDDFRERYRTLHLGTLRARSAADAESRLDLAERILIPRRLVDVATPTALATLQAELLTGAAGRRRSPRSPHTVRSYLGTVLAAMNWAYQTGWLNEPPRVRKIRAPRGTAMRGRPITDAEFEAMLAATPVVVGDAAAPTWRYVLEGLWSSALRLGELLSVSWDNPLAIRPEWPEHGSPRLQIPGAMQKNGRDDTIPLVPWFESVLLDTPEPRQTGWAFCPASLQPKSGRAASNDRPSVAWVGRVISRIGRAAAVVVEPADPRTGRGEKYASAHDLRRSCGERLREAGVPPLVICRVMRHSSWETTQKHYAPGDLENEAARLREALG